MSLTKTVKTAIQRINRRVMKETGDDISDFLYDAVETTYEYDDEGKKASSEYIIDMLESEANTYIDVNLYEGSYRWRRLIM